MNKKEKNILFDNLPVCAAEFIKLVIKKMRYRRKVRAEVQAELTAHFEDELRDCKTDEDKEQKARELISDFGDPKLLGVLLRRAKKRCRPLWRKALVRSFQVVGVIILYFMICFGRLGIGTPNISVNYVDWLNEVVRADSNEADNARPYYEKAVELYAKMPPWLSESRAKWPADLNDVQLNSLSVWLKDNKQAIEMLREAAERPYYWNRYQSDETDLSKGGVVGNAMKPLRGYRHLAYAMRWQIWYEAYNGDVDRAFNDCIVLLKFGSHQQGKGLLIEQLVGIAIEALAQSAISMIIEKVDVPADALKNIQEQLQNEYARAHNVINLEAEKAFFYDLVQRSFTDNGKGGGRVLLKGLPLVVGGWKSFLFDFVTMKLPDRQEVISRIDEFYEHADNVTHKTPWELRKEDSNLKRDNDSLLLGILTPAFERVIELSWRHRVSRQALVAIVAILRCEKEKGQYPSSLQHLVEAAYLKELPMDPWSDGPLLYRRTDKGFILYGVGPNFKDDGGQVVRDNRGRIEKYADQGDWVFWPVNK